MSEIRFTLPSSNLLPGALAALAAAALLWPTAASSQERGRLVSVEAGGDAAASSVELVGDRPLSFTTLKLQAPPRVVVDFADTEIAGAAAEVEVSDGTVRRVATAAAGQKTARVVIELVAEAEFDVRAHGNRVEVRIPRIAPLVAKTEPPATGQAAATATEPTAAESETEKRASLPTVALVGSGAKAPGAEPARALTPAEKAAKDKREKAAAAVQAARDRRAAAAEKVAAAQRAKVERAAAAKQAVLDRRLAAAEKAAAGQRAKAEKAAAAREQKLAAEKLAADKRAAQAARSRSAAPQRTLAVAGSGHSITGIGFRPSGAGQVIVRSDQPLEYGVSGDASAVVLHLPGASIPLANNRHPLDTRFFNGPVQRVVPLAVEGGTDLRIELQARADYQLEQSGSVLTVTFSVPR